MAPRHKGRIECETSSAVGRICAQNGDAGHFSAETIIKEIAHAAFGSRSAEINRRLNADGRVALSRIIRICDQRLIERWIALKTSPSRSILVGQSDGRIRKAEVNDIQQSGRNRLGEAGDQVQARSDETVWDSWECRG